MNNPADEISQAIKRSVMENERKVGSSYFHHAQASADDDRGGRFAAVNPTSVTGSTPASQYPRQPATPPWSHDPCGLEPSLGYVIDQQEAVGEPHEIAASLASTSVDAGDSDGPTEDRTEAVRSVTANKGKV